MHRCFSDQSELEIPQQSFEALRVLENWEMKQSSCSRYSDHSVLWIEWTSGAQRQYFVLVVLSDRYFPKNDSVPFF